MHSLKSLAMELETIMDCGIDVLISVPIRDVREACTQPWAYLEFRVFSWSPFGSQDEEHLEV